MTRERILDVAETLIQTRGYNAFSYQDIADALDIRKASIHYHFASKGDLGVAVVDRYSKGFAEALASLIDDNRLPSMSVLENYVRPYVEFSGTSDRVCLCGALAGEILALPPDMRVKVQQFFVDHQDWLTHILERGEKNGEFHLGIPARKMARSVFSALQGALLVKRTTGSASQLFDVIDVLKQQISRRPASAIATSPT